MTDCPTTIEPTVSLPEDRAAAFLTIDLSKIAENYQRRSGPEVVLAALEKHLD